MNVYVRETARELARMGVAVDVFTRSQNASIPRVADLGEGARVIHLPAGPHAPIERHAIHPHLPEFIEGVEAHRWAEGIDYDVIHAHYWLSGVAGPRAARAMGRPHGADVPHPGKAQELGGAGRGGARARAPDRGGVAHREDCRSHRGRQRGGARPSRLVLRRHLGGDLRHPLRRRYGALPADVPGRRQGSPRAAARAGPPLRGQARADQGARDAAGGNGEDRRGGAALHRGRRFGRAVEPARRAAPARGWPRSASTGACASSGRSPSGGSATSTRRPRRRSCPPTTSPSAW